MDSHTPEDFGKTVIIFPAPNEAKPSNARRYATLLTNSSIGRNRSANSFAYFSLAIGALEMLSRHPNPTSAASFAGISVAFAATRLQSNAESPSEKKKLKIVTASTLALWGAATFIVQHVTKQPLVWADFSQNPAFHHAMNRASEIAECLAFGYGGMSAIAEATGTTRLRRKKSHPVQSIR